MKKKKNVSEIIACTITITIITITTITTITITIITITITIITITTTTITTIIIIIIIIMPCDEDSVCYLSLDMLRCHPQFVAATNIITNTINIITTTTIIITTIIKNITNTIINIITNTIIKKQHHHHRRRRRRKLSSPLIQRHYCRHAFLLQLAQVTCRYPIKKHSAFRVHVFGVWWPAADLR